MIDPSARRASAHAIPAVRPDVGPEESAAVAAVLLQGRLAQGPRVEELERRWAAFIGTRHAVAVANGTVALMAIHAGLGLGPGDEVDHRQPRRTGHRQRDPRSTGATPVFVDIEPDTFLIDAKRIEAAITAADAGDLPGPPATGCRPTWT